MRLVFMDPKQSHPEPGDRVLTLLNGGAGGNQFPTMAMTTRDANGVWMAELSGTDVSQHVMGWVDVTAVDVQTLQEVKLGA